jgi:hypothetical protein
MIAARSRGFEWLSPAKGAISVAMLLRPRTFLRALTVAAVLSVCGAAGATEAPVKAVIELFTSQGCHSCPPADRLAGRLATRESVVMLSLPVDYWDYLGWRDTLAESAFSARQRGYARARGDRHIYTPQMVINGLEEVVGSDVMAIADAIERTSADKTVLCTPVTVHQTGGRITVAVGSHPGLSGEVILAAFARHRTVAIGAGENAESRVTYTNVVRKLTPLGRWTGAPASFAIDRTVAVPPDADDFVALLQAGHLGQPGAILGVARAPEHTVSER